MPPARMLPEHERVFLTAAKHFNVFILVRRTNLASMKYIADHGFSAKRLDCKAKTADRDVDLHGVGLIECAGLVADPTILGRAAYDSDKKYHSALAIWEEFRMEHLHERIRTLEGQQSVGIVPEGKQYFVDLAPGSPRHGCLKYTQGLLTAGKYIHGDFDLYGIVPADHPEDNIAVFEMRQGQKHARSPQFMDVQMFVNSRVGKPMILHGAQDTYAEQHSDEAIDIFEPNGAIGGAESLEQIEWWYAHRFKGRKLFRKTDQRHFGYDGATPFEGYKTAL